MELQIPTQYMLDKLLFYLFNEFQQTSSQVCDEVCFSLDFVKRLWYVFVLERSVIHYDNA